MSNIGPVYSREPSYRIPDQVFRLALTLPRRVNAISRRLGKALFNPSAAAARFSASPRPAATPASGALIPKTLSAASSLPTAMSQSRTNSGITSAAFFPHFQSLDR